MSKKALAARGVASLTLILVGGTERVALSGLLDPLALNESYLKLFQYEARGKFILELTYYGIQLCIQKV